MFLRESAPIAAILTAAAVAPTAPAAAAAPTASALPMAFVRLPLSAVAALPALTLFGSPRPCLPPVFASAMSPHH